MLSLGALAAVTSSADAPLPAAGTTTRSLDKALGGDLSTGDRNLDLLLDAQRKGMDRLDESPAAREMPQRPANGRLAIQPLPEPARPVETPVPLPTGNRAAAPLAMPGQVLQAAPHGTVPRANRDWSGGAGQAAAGLSESGAGDNTDAKRSRAVDAQLRELFFEVVAFVKSHLIEIVAVWTFIALLVAGVRAYSRRI